MAQRPKGQFFDGRAFGRRGFALALGALLALGTPVLGQTVAPAAQVLTLDQDRLYTESLYGKALEARISAANQALAAENRKIEQGLANEEADLTAKRPGMTPSAFQALADAFDAKVEQVRADQAAKIEAMKTQREEGRKAFFQATVPVLAELMQQMGAFAILNRSAVVLAFDSIDVTDRAIKALDEKLWFYSGPQWTLNTFLQVATNNRQTTSNTYNLNTGIGYILGLQHNLNDRWAINLETIPSFSVSYQWDNRTGSESETFSANAFLSNAVRVGIVRRF
jgi:Skp family chaperone for outer membrane proteins